jgi:hypothetical protein
LELPVDVTSSARTLTYELKPDSFGQLVVKLRLEVVLSPRTGPGFALISGSSNGCTGAQVNLHVDRTGRGRTKSTWTSVGLIEGVNGGTFRRGKARIDFENYFPACKKNIKPGINRMTIGLEQFGNIALSRVAVLPGSTVEATDVEPAHLVLETDFPDPRPVVKHPFDINFTVANTGDLEAKDVVVSLDPVSAGIAVKGRTSYRVPVLKDSRSGSFSVDAPQLGQYSLKIHAGSSNSNQPSVTVVADVGLSDGEDSGIWLLVAGWTVGVGCLMAFVVRRVRRRRDAPP